MLLHDVNVLVGATGSVASLRVPRLTKLLLEKGAAVRVVMTKSAKNFVQVESDFPAGVQVHDDLDEWQCWKKKSDPVLHIELRKWADIFLVAPLSANTLAKMANGLCDNLLTSVARAWPLETDNMIFLAPAMNTMMWEHPITAQQLDTLSGYGMHIIQPISKVLACGDFGDGAMQEPEMIVESVIESWTRWQAGGKKT